MSDSELSERVLAEFKRLGWRLYDSENFSTEKGMNEPICDIQSGKEYVVYPSSKTARTGDILAALSDASCEYRLTAVNTPQGRVDVASISFDSMEMTITLKAESEQIPPVHVGLHDIVEHLKTHFRSNGEVDDYYSSEVMFKSFDWLGYSLAYMIKESDEPQIVRVGSLLREGVTYFFLPKQENFSDADEYTRRETEAYERERPLFSVIIEREEVSFNQLEIGKSYVYLDSNTDRRVPSTQFFNSVHESLKYIPREPINVEKLLRCALDDSSPSGDKGVIRAHFERAFRGSGNPVGEA